MTRGNLSFLLSILSILISVVGWIVVHLLTQHRENKREKRNELKESIDTICELIDKVTENSNIYFITSEHPKKKLSEAAIYHSFERLWGCAHRLENNHSEIKICNSIESFYEEVTGDDFGSDNQYNNKDAVKKIQKISILGEEIVNKVRDWYTNSVSPK